MEIRRRVIWDRASLTMRHHYVILQVYNSCLGDYDEAIRLGTEAMAIFKKSVGTEHPYYSTSLTHLAQYNTMDEKYLEAFYYLQHCLNNSQSYILNNFTSFHLAFKKKCGLVIMHINLMIYYLILYKI